MFGSTGADVTTPGVIEATPTGASTALVDVVVTVAAGGAVVVLIDVDVQVLDALLGAAEVGHGLGDVWTG